MRWWLGHFRPAVIRGRQNRGPPPPFSEQQPSNSKKNNRGELDAKFAEPHPRHPPESKPNASETIENPYRLRLPLGKSQERIRTNNNYMFYVVFYAVIFLHYISNRKQSHRTLVCVLGCAQAVCAHSLPLYDSYQGLDA